MPLLKKISERKTKHILNKLSAVEIHLKIICVTEYKTDMSLPKKI